MNVDTQARILSAFLLRMNSAQIATLAALVRDTEQASLNQSLSAQLEAHNKVSAGAESALRSVNDYDLHTMSNVINHELRKRK